jgi:hypothetical protein
MATTWHPDFAPSYTPKQMLEKGVFEGKYINAIKGLPKDWYDLPRVVGPKDEPDTALNYFKVKSRQPLSVWRHNGWTTKDSPLGWFQWYCLYYLERRLPKEDDWQIKRWRSFVARHMGQVKASCSLKDDTCHTKQRQGLLQWAWDSHTEVSDVQLKKNRDKLLKATGTRVATESILSLNW